MFHGNDEPEGCYGQSFYINLNSCLIYFTRNAFLPHKHSPGILFLLQFLQNRGVYMFRIDNDTVIDATMAGGPARYINHSCSPNCVAEVVHFEKESKIIIITSRRIPKGEEVRSQACSVGSMGVLC